MPPAFLCSLSCRKNTLTFLLLLPDRLFFFCLVLFSFSYKPLKTRCKLLPFRSKRLAYVSCSFFFSTFICFLLSPFFFFLISAKRVAFLDNRFVSILLHTYICVIFLFHLFFFFPSFDAFLMIYSIYLCNTELSGMWCKSA